MSNVKKHSALATAIVVGLGLSAAAAAYTVKTAGDTDPVMVATADIVDETTHIGVNEAVEIALTPQDFILGRTTGFTIRVGLNRNAELAEAIDNTDLTVGAPNATWVATVAAGGAVGDDYIVINMDPSGTPVALTTGALLNINAATSVTAPGATGLVLENLELLQAKGNVVQAAITFVDPVTAQEIMDPSAVDLLESGDPVVMGCDATVGETMKRIDVGAGNGQDSKTFFSTTGQIGANDSGYINLGAIEVERAAGFDTSFAYAATDEFTTVLNGDFSAFAASNPDAVGVFLSPAANCSVVDVMGVVSIPNGTVTFEYAGSDVTGFAATGFSSFVCAQVDPGNEVVIDDSNVVATTTWDRGAVTSSGDQCPLLPLSYNGSVVEVFHINPDGNPETQTFLRIINRSDQAGLVTIEGIDDAGNSGASAISFEIGAGESKQINSHDLEAGKAGVTGAWGNGTGKWRAVVTGEFSGMVVQGLNRNLNDGTVTNLTDADTRGEQVLNSLFDNQ